MQHAVVQELWVRRIRNVWLSDKLCMIAGDCLVLGLLGSA